VYGDEIQFFIFFSIPQMVCRLNQMVEELGQDVGGETELNGRRAWSGRWWWSFGLGLTAVMTSGELMAGAAMTSDELMAGAAAEYLGLGSAVAWRRVELSGW
jgi:hypothetical protein